jgi:hypothetical protein
VREGNEGEDDTNDVGNTCEVFCSGELSSKYNILWRASLSFLGMIILGRFSIRTNADRSVENEFGEEDDDDDDDVVVVVVVVVVFVVVGDVEETEGVV